MNIDWEDRRYFDGVLCVFSPRATYMGRAIKPKMLEKAGMQIVLRKLWYMDKNDPYPGEYALSTVDSCRTLMEKLGVAWVASGDVTVVSYKDGIHDWS
jgi:hypothetical protein